MSSATQSPPPYECIPVSEMDTRFPSMQQGFNRRWIGHNIQSIYIVYTPEGTCAALDDAVSKYGCTVQIISGGHCYENFVFNENVKAIINVTALTDAGKDDDKGYYLSSGDTNWNSFCTVFRNYGKVIPGGSCYSVGLGGHISGGGDGILSRLHGLTVDWLTGVEVVVKPDINASSILKYVSCDSPDPDDRDLFWAHTGGGGGNFGVITKYYFKDLPVAPKGFVASYVTFQWSKLTEQRLGALLEWYFTLAEEAPLETVGKFPIMHEAAGEFVMYLYTSYVDDAGRQEALGRHYDMEQELANIMPISAPSRVTGGHGGILPFPMRKRKVHALKSAFMADQTFDYPTYALVQTMNGSGPNQRGKYKSAYMKKRFPPEQIAAIYRNLKNIPAGLEASDMTDSLVQVDIFAGKINEVAPDATAIAQRSYFVKLQYQTYWQYEMDDAKHLEWIRTFYQDMYGPYGGVPDPWTSVPSGKGVFEGCYYNYPDVDLNDWKDGKYGALELYFLGNLGRLIRTKKRWDPNDIFNHEQSIPPEAPAAA